MWKVTKLTHKFLGRIPELNYVLLRDVQTRQLELWTESKGLSVKALRLQGIELEYIREAKAAYRVIDNEFNRDHYSDDIGRIYIDTPPGYAIVKEL